MVKEEWQFSESPKSIGEKSTGRRSLNEGLVASSAVWHPLIGYGTRIARNLDRKSSQELGKGNRIESRKGQQFGDVAGGGSSGCLVRQMCTRGAQTRHYEGVPQFLHSCCRWSV